MLQIALGNIIKEHRLMKNLSRQELGELTNLDSNNMGRFERGEQLPNLLTMIKLMDTLKIRYDENISQINEIITKKEL